MRIWISACVLLWAGEASASFHLAKVHEIFPGSVASPKAQYIELEETASEPALGGRSITIYGPDGTTVRGSATVRADIGTVSSGGTVLVTTPEADALFTSPAYAADGTINPSGISADVPVIDISGGKICWSASTDCFAWGSYSGGSAGVGTPFRQGENLVLGRAVERRKTTALVDSANSATDFVFADEPTPRGKTDNTGVAVGVTCGNGNTDSIEGCDDGNVDGNDGCSPQCQVEVCGDGVVNGDEACDDQNFISGDGCEPDCTQGDAGVCGNGTVDAGEECDDGNTDSGDDCSATCQNVGGGNNNGGGGGDDGGCQAVPAGAWVTLAGLLVAARLVMRRRRV